MTYHTVTAEAVVYPSVVEVTATVSPALISVNAELATQLHYSEYPDYEGAVEFVPSAQPQTVQIENMVAHQNIIIDPIPQNYGLITWDGSTLTVS